jgi:hypothetical protein
MLQPVEIQNSLQTQFARAQIFLPKQLLGFLMLLKFLLEEYLVWFTRPVEVFLHRRFGVRGFGTFQTLQLVAVGVLAGWSGASQDLPAALFCIVSAVLAVYHRYETVRSEMRGVLRHSYSNGEPIPIWGWARIALQAFGIDPNRFVTVSLICRFYEPILILAIGLSIRPVSVALGGYLIGCSAALFIKNLIVHNRLLNMKRDSIDGRIFASWLSSIHRKTADGSAEEKYFVVRLADPPVRKRDDEDGGFTANLPEQQPAAETGIIVEPPFLEVQCRKCKREFRLHRKYSGKRGKCLKCGEITVIAAEMN